MDRRTFLKDAAGAIAGGAAFTPQSASAQSAAPQTRPAPQPPQDDDSLTTDRCGADCMVDVVKAIGLEYICANPARAGLVRDEDDYPWLWRE